MRSSGALEDVPLLASPGPNVGSKDPTLLEHPAGLRRAHSAHSLGSYTRNSGRAAGRASNSYSREVEDLGQKPGHWHHLPEMPPFPLPATPPPPRRAFDWSDRAPSSPPRLGGSAPPWRRHEVMRPRAEMVALSPDEQEEEIAKFLGGLISVEDQREENSGLQTPRTPPRGKQLKTLANGSERSREKTLWSGASDSIAATSAEMHDAALPEGPPSSPFPAPSIGWETPRTRSYFTETPPLPHGGSRLEQQDVLHSRPIGSGASGQPSEEKEILQVLRLPCQVCGRRFREDRLAVHEAICQRNANHGHQRHVFESKEQRCGSVNSGWWSPPPKNICTSSNSPESDFKERRSQSLPQKNGRPMATSSADVRLARRQPRTTSVARTSSPARRTQKQLARGLSQPDLETPPRPEAPSSMHRAAQVSAQTTLQVSLRRKTGSKGRDVLSANLHDSQRVPGLAATSQKAPQSQKNSRLGSLMRTPPPAQKLRQAGDTSVSARGSDSGSSGSNEIFAGDLPSSPLIPTSSKSPSSPLQTRHKAVSQRAAPQVSEAGLWHSWLTQKQNMQAPVPQQRYQHGRQQQSKKQEQQQRHQQQQQLEQEQQHLHQQLQLQMQPQTQPQLLPPEAHLELETKQKEEPDSHRIQPIPAQPLLQPEPKHQQQQQEHQQLEQPQPQPQTQLQSQQDSQAYKQQQLQQPPLQMQQSMLQHANASTSCAIPELPRWLASRASFSRAWWETSPEDDLDLQPHTGMAVCDEDSRQTHAHDHQKESPGLLGQIMGDVAELSAQVDKLLSRRQKMAAANVDYS
eukprot:TRINITY_DN6837_c0_g1_i1.p1 TRINITY_DN6837_c0_g1~~TRINITY_DN6837_c0_g1_i1.p1  ORF type:complete len:800 (-),score=153.70 TRINITY_DN6837_c0_g1_i1:163-2562(-)